MTSAVGATGREDLPLTLACDSYGLVFVNMTFGLASSFEVKGIQGWSTMGTVIVTVLVAGESLGAVIFGWRLG